MDYTELQDDYGEVRGNKAGVGEVWVWGGSRLYLQSECNTGWYWYILKMKRHWTLAHWWIKTESDAKNNMLNNIRLKIFFFNKMVQQIVFNIFDIHDTRFGTKNTNIKFPDYK